MSINEDVIRFMTVRVEQHEEGPSAMMQGAAAGATTAASGGAASAARGGRGFDDLDFVGWRQGG